MFVHNNFDHDACSSANCLKNYCNCDIMNEKGPFYYARLEPYKMGYLGTAVRVFVQSSPKLAYQAHLWAY